jgi:hypothetical protein
VPDPDKLIRKLTKRVGDYFDSRYGLNDFKLTGLVLTTDIDVRSRKKVADYIKVLQRVGKVKGFSPPDVSWIDENISLCLEGNSNGIDFMIYDLEALLRGRMNKDESEHKQLRPIAKKSEGLLRAEVRLTELKAVRSYTDEDSTSGQITDLLTKGEEVFLDTFLRAVPFGDFHKKDKAEEIVRKGVTDMRLRRLMLRLITLIPEKKSLLLAIKALNYRKVEEVMETFASLDLSPVTISKRHDIKKLDNLYKFMLNQR